MSIRYMATRSFFAYFVFSVWALAAGVAVLFHLYDFALFLSLMAIDQSINGDKE